MIIFIVSIFVYICSKIICILSLCLLYFLVTDLSQVQFRLKYHITVYVTNNKLLILEQAETTFLKHVYVLQYE